MQSMIVAFSMYSKIPVPRIEWTKQNMKYALCFFPFVGVVVGAVQYLALWLCGIAKMGVLFKGCIAILIPVVITGGIHMDGYLDTIDAISSYADREKRLDILKDSNSGAFAIIYGLIYLTCSLGIWSEMDNRAIILIGISYVISRTLSALSIAAFPKAKNTGLAATFQDGAHRKNVIRIMLAYLIIESTVLFVIGIVPALVVIGVAVISFGLHYWLCMSKFGGITGDLAGFFLQVNELLVLAGVMVLFKCI